jgi:phosphoribosylformimino-5-aminoimidazole carboxamide ribonucleotide (ProFAR) isomerase
MITIIPAIDLIDAKCVRLSQGDYNQKTVYNENPLEVAKMFEDAGIKRLHLVDLDGAKAKHIVNHKVLETIASKTNLVIDFGGGLKSDEDLRIAFESGATNGYRWQHCRERPRNIPALDRNLRSRKNHPGCRCQRQNDCCKWLAGSVGTSNSRFH